MVYCESQVRKVCTGSKLKQTAFIRRIETRGRKTRPPMTYLHQRSLKENFLHINLKIRSFRKKTISTSKKKIINLLSISPSSLSSETSTASSSMKELIFNRFSGRLVFTDSFFFWLLIFLGRRFSKSSSRSSRQAHALRHMISICDSIGNFNLH